MKQTEFVVKQGDPDKLMVNPQIAPNKAIYREIKEYIDRIYHPDLMTNPEKLSEEEHKSQIIYGLYVQKLFGNWLKVNLPHGIEIVVNDKVGENKYDTDQYDILIENKLKIDVKTSKALRQDHNKTHVVVVIGQEGDFFKIRGWWITKELKSFKKQGFYLIPDNKLKPIKSFIRRVIKKYAKTRKTKHGKIKDIR